MSLFNVFNISGSALNAQSIRLNLTSSNLANAESVSNSSETAYRSRHPVFQAVLDDVDRAQVSGTVQVTEIVESQVSVPREYRPGHPLADGSGYVHLSNVNVVEEMANMISASRTYQSNVEIAKTAKQLLMQTLRLGD